jgi:hypothetical protein
VARKFGAEKLFNAELDWRLAKLPPACNLQPPPPRQHFSQLNCAKVVAAWEDEAQFCCHGCHARLRLSRQLNALLTHISTASIDINGFFSFQLSIYQ